MGAKSIPRKFQVLIFTMLVKKSGSIRGSSPLWGPLDLWVFSRGPFMVIPKMNGGDAFANTYQSQY